LLANFEAQFAAEYHFDQDEIWRQAHAVANEAAATIAERCRELGVPARFAPRVELDWYDRGENASRQRRAELRGVAQTRNAAIEQAVRAEIER
jgi:hypothetical protein